MLESELLLAADPPVPPVAGVDPGGDGVALIMARILSVKNYPLFVVRVQCILEDNANIIGLKVKIILEENGNWKVTLDKKVRRYSWNDDCEN